MQKILRTAAASGLLFIVGCGGGGGLTPNQKVQANKQWNDARANVLASLAADQFKNGNLEKCQETLDQALRLEPDKAPLHILAAKLSIEQGDLEPAEAHLAAARRLDPRNAEADYLTGIVLQRWHKSEEARAAYAAAVQKEPAELSYLLADAEMLVAIDKPAEAVALLQSKAAFFEHSGVIRDEIGQLLIQQKQYAKGIDALREASILSSEDPTIREHLAFALYTDGQFVEAAASFNRLLKEPNYQSRADIQAALGDCLARSQQLTDAIKQYDAATRLNPGCSGYWLGFAKVAVQLNDLPRADLAVRKAISLEPANSDAQCLFGYISLKQNKLAQSLAAFRNAAELNPTDSVSVCMQGYVLDRMGRKAEAPAFYARAHEIDPDDALANRLWMSAGGTR